MWPPFFFGAIPTYGVLPYAMIYSHFLSQDILDTDQSVNYYTFAHLWQSVTYYVLLTVCCSGKNQLAIVVVQIKVSLKNTLFANKNYLRLSLGTCTSVSNPLPAHFCIIPIYEYDSHAQKR